MNDTGSVYEIHVRAHLDSSWTDWYDGVSLANEEDGRAILTLPGEDQALLHGVLGRIRDLNLELLSVRRIDDGGSHQ